MHQLSMTSILGVFKWCRYWFFYYTFEYAFLWFRIEFASDTTLYFKYIVTFKKMNNHGILRTNLTELNNLNEFQTLSTKVDIPSFEIQLGSEVTNYLNWMIFSFLIILFCDSLWVYGVIAMLVNKKPSCFLLSSVVAHFI